MVATAEENGLAAGGTAVGLEVAQMQGYCTWWNQCKREWENGADAGGPVVRHEVSPGVGPVVGLVGGPALVSGRPVVVESVRFV